MSPDEIDLLYRAKANLMDRVIACERAGLPLWWRPYMRNLRLLLAVINTLEREDRDLRRVGAKQ